MNSRLRIPADEYRTPHWAIETILKEFYWPSITRILEPCAGDGRIVTALLNSLRLFGWGQKGLCVEHGDIRKGQDYLTRPAPPHLYDLIITNPPFNFAQEITKKALSEARSVCMLQRLNWLEGQARMRWWQTHEPSHLFVLSKRPSFINICAVKDCLASFHPEDQPAGTECPICGLGKVRADTDSTGYAWFVWDDAECTKLKRKEGIYHL